MKTTVGASVALFVLAILCLPAEGGSLPYRHGPRGGNQGTILYYEVTQDYSVNLVDRFRPLHLLPGGVGGLNGKWLGRPLGWKKTKTQMIALQNYVNTVLAKKTLESDFIELANGVLTVKQGYRWDGASTVGNDWNLTDNPSIYIRGSCLHDSMYDMMRMGYLDHDEKGSDDYRDKGFMNRLVADCLMAMIFKEDKENTLINEFKFVRYGGANKTKANGKNLGGKLLLAPWKNHVSELEAWVTDEGVEFKWSDADAAGNDPGLYGRFGHSYHIERFVDPLDPHKIVGTVQDWLPFPGIDYYDASMSSYFTDRSVRPGQTYHYLVKSAIDESGLSWDDRHYDHSNIVMVTVPTTFHAVPLPSSALLAGVGLALLSSLVLRRRRRLAKRSPR